MRLSLALSASLLLLAASCSPDAPAPGASTSQAIELWARYVQITCAKGRACCEEQQLSTPELAACEDELPRQHGIPEILRFIDERSVTLDGARFARCLDAAEATSNTCDGPPPSAECLDVLRGNLEEGGACESAIQCSAPQGGAVCLRVIYDESEHESERESAKGVCRTDVRGSLGSPCSQSCPTGRCFATSTMPAPAQAIGFCFGDDGLYCDWSAGKCAALAALGEPCSEDEVCGASAFCNQGRCERIEGAHACEDSGDCDEGYACVEGHCTPYHGVDEDFCGGDYD